MKMIKYFSMVAVLIVSVWFFFTYNTSQYQVLNGETMGTMYNIKIRTSVKDSMLYGRIREKLDDVNKHMSVFDNNSEINKINNAQAGEWIELSPEMSEVLKASYIIYKKTNGAFDPTIGKLVDLWGFGASKNDHMPTQEEIDEVLSYSGFQHIQFSPDYTKLKKDNEKTYMNLSAIAKGYGVDVIAKLLQDEGYKDFLVEIGGEIVARGNRDENAKGWNIGVMNPKNLQENIAVVNLTNSAVATSGDYFNYMYVDNAVYSHTISMKDGKPVRSNLTAVTVFSDSCKDADAYATSFMVMGEKEAIAFANKNKIKSLFFIKDETGKITIESSQTAKYILDENNVRN